MKNLSECFLEIQIAYLPTGNQFDTGFDSDRWLFTSKRDQKQIEFTTVDESGTIKTEIKNARADRVVYQTVQTLEIFNNELIESNIRLVPRTDYLFYQLVPDWFTVKNESGVINDLESESRQERLPEYCRAQCKALLTILESVKKEKE